MPAGVPRTTRTAVTARPKTNTSVGQPTSSPPTPSSTGTGPAPVRRTKPASTKPMSAMNRPMPTPIAVLSCIGMALKMTRRRPTRTSSRMTSPSSTTRPIASAQLICDAIENVTKALSPSPVATANG